MIFTEELRLYEQVNRGATYWQVEVYSYQGNRWETSRGLRALKEWRRGNFESSREAAVQLAKTSLIKVTLPYKGGDGGYLLDNQYYLVDEPQGRPIDLSSPLDLERVAKFLAKLHKLALFASQEKMLSIHILPETFYVGRYGELVLWGFEKLRIEDPLLSLTHLLHDCEDDAAREFVLNKYAEIRPISKQETLSAEQKIWDSAIMLGQLGKKQVDSQQQLEKIRELINLVWPLISTQEYTNIPISQPSLSISDLNDLQISYPKMDLSVEKTSVPVNNYYGENWNTINVTNLPPCEEELLQRTIASQSAQSFQSEVEATAQEVLEQEPLQVVYEEKPDQGIEEEANNLQEKLPVAGGEEEKRNQEQVEVKTEPIAWKPFPKLPNRRW